ncbi:transposase family protein [Spirillospora sp. NPDC046719]
MTPALQALMTLAQLRKGETFAELDAGFVVSTTNAWRYVNEAIATRWRPGRPNSVPPAIDRVVADRPYYLGKHHPTA